MSNNFTYGVERGIAVISRYGDESKELNLISYGNRPPKYDLRTWKEQPDGGRIMCKGITLTREEAKALKNALVEEFKQELD